MTLLDCAYFDAGRCGSCTLIRTPYERQLEDKQRHARRLIDGFGPAGRGIDWLPSVASALSGFRTKAKMVVGGTANAPTLGILDDDAHGVDLSSCPIIDVRILAAFPELTAFISRARIEPYDVPARRGELKQLIVTVSPAGELMVRFVLRSSEPVARIRKHLPGLLAALPALRVVTANLLPEHKAAIEGETELVLSEDDSLEMDLHGLALHLLPHSFFQTNTDIARALYRQGRAWIDDSDPASLWDLYCGVGGFALHSTGPGRAVTGVELSEEAVASARRSAAEAGARAEFVAADATDWALRQPVPPELVVVNPPRRGIGPALAGWLEASEVPTVLYSSCNAESLARDLAAMPSLLPVRAQLFDMFPHTSHFETLVLLERAAGTKRFGDPLVS